MSHQIQEFWMISKKVYISEFNICILYFSIPLNKVKKYAKLGWFKIGNIIIFVLKR